MPPDWLPALTGTAPKLKHFLYFYFLLSLISLTDADSDCSLVGKGACRGDGWSEGQWPLGAGVQSVDDCEDLCQDKQGCTGFSLSKQGDCFLYGHHKLVPASALGGECYKCAVQAKSTAKPKQPTKDSKPAESKPKQPAKPAKEAAKPAKEAAKPAKEAAKPVKGSAKPEKKPVKDEAKAKKVEKSKEPPKPTQDAKAKSQKPASVKQESVKSKPVAATPPVKVKTTAAPVKTKPAENSAKSKATAETKKAQIQSMKVDGKYLKLVGEGGCRGKDWNKGDFPLDQGKKSIEACAKACKDNKCTAFHVLHEEKAKYDCLLFGHTNVLAVHGLGGQCYTLSDLAPKAAKKESHDITTEKEREVKGPVNMAALGAGRCRGQDWTFSYWPIIHQHLTAKECATACAKKMGCTAFDLSERNENGKFECALYGHSKVVPAIGVPGNCYVLSDKPGELPASFAKAKPSPKKAPEKPPTKAPQKPEAKPVEKKKAAPQPTKTQKAEQAVKKPPPPPPAKTSTKVETKKATSKPVPKVETKKSDKPSKDQKKANEPAAKQEKKPKTSSKTTGPISGKFIVSVGEGGCRGLDWDKGVWPVVAGKRLKNACATMCLKNGCTAFHILHEENGLYDCLLFGHDDLIAVKGLGGECLKLSSTPDNTGDDDDSDVELKVTGPVHMAALGKGRCRGEGWTFKKWPAIKGYLSPKDCAVECAKRKGCTAFDLSEKQEDGSFECALYGHKKVEPASGVPGNCYVLSDKPGKIPEGIGAAAVEAEEDDGEEIAVSGPVEFHALGQGRCRGPAWSTKSWPKVKGNLIAVDCATECAKRKGCTAFDIGMMGEGVEECALYGHKSVAPAIGVPGKCYALGDGPSYDNDEDSDDDEDEEEDEQIVEDAVYKHLGHGMCRGANWQGKKWPVLRGLRTLQECANACKKKKGCTSFDTSSPEGDKFDCMLYGHKNAIPAPGVPGECYSLLGAQYVPEPEEAPKTESRAKILDEDDMDYINIKDVELLGKGACRGQGWQAGKWPLMKGRTTLKDCAESCKKAKGCVAFDLSNKEKDKYDCMLLGHPDVLPASALAAKCYIIKGARPVLSTLVDSDSPTVFKIKADDIYPGSGHGYMKIGSGLCRGVGWQNNEWPIDKGMKTQKDCAQSCDKQRGCQAFDLSNQVGKTFSCLLFNHKSLSVATALTGACYTKTAGNLHTETTADDVEEEEEDVIIDIDGELDLALLGKGGCRGAGWQENGWPKVKGFLSIDECGAKCVGTKGCTAFHTAYSKEGSKKLFECFLFGHKSVVPASGLPGNCYTVSAGSSTIIKTKARKPKSAAKGKQYKIPKFDQPRVVEDSYDEDDDEWLFSAPPAEIRSREHITSILGLAEKANNEILKATETTLKELKKVYETSIKPLEKMYNYRELSNRHFGDPEIFNKPLIVFLGPWSGGKSTIMNYLLGTEYTKDAFRSTAEPSPGFNFNLAMYGDTAEDVDGTQLSAEWAFSSLQKFGQEFFKKLRGKKLPNKLLEKVTLAEIPGVLETGTIRKIDRRYPFNDACQWFIDHADLIVLVYDYAKLDIGPETEALLDQLKGREQQVRILLNKADEITAEELLKIQGNLVWNVSPLMASAEPPTLYAGSFWSQPYKNGAPKRLLKSQEQSLLKDIREAIDKRVENRIATARRFAVRVRNHAKMVDCYLTTYKNNKGFFGDKKRVAQDIIENPGKYHIYEGISRLTNISRYDLPDPDTYRDFFNVHALYDFETLQSTCTFFKGCPLNKLDIAISYDLPDILNNYKKKVQLALNPPTPPKQKPTLSPTDAKQKNKKK